MAAVNNWNDRIIEEFRANDGKVGGPFEGVSVLLLHHTGARTGTVRVNPLAYQADGDRFVVFGSKGGAPTNPDWYHNLRAHPQVAVEVGTETIAVRARVAEGEERERIWNRQKELLPAFAAYEQRTRRQIPVIILERSSDEIDARLGHEAARREITVSEVTREPIESHLGGGRHRLIAARAGRSGRTTTARRSEILRGKAARTH